MAPDRHESDQAKGTKRLASDSFPQWSLWLAVLIIAADILRYWSAADFWSNIALGSLAGLVVLESMTLIWPLMAAPSQDQGTRSPGIAGKRRRGIVVGLAAMNLLLRLLWPSLGSLPIGLTLSLAILLFAARDMAAVLRAKWQETDASDPPTGVY
jgi:hypothetical protein